MSERTDRLDTVDHSLIIKLCTINLSIRDVTDSTTSISVLIAKEGINTLKSEMNRKQPSNDTRSRRRFGPHQTLQSPFQLLMASRAVLRLFRMIAILACCSPKVYKCVGNPIGVRFKGGCRCSSWQQRSKPFFRCELRNMRTSNHQRALRMGEEFQVQSTRHHTPHRFEHRFQAIASIILGCSRPPGTKVLHAFDHQTPRERYCRRLAGN